MMVGSREETGEGRRATIARVGSSSSSLVDKVADPGKQ